MPAFKLIVLGSDGGPRENNLSGFLLAPFDSTDFITLDAGTLLTGIDIAYRNHHFADIVFNDRDLTPAGTIFLKHIKAYLITHAHLDHVAALVFNSQSDISKPILALDPTIDNLRDHLFNDRIWADFGDEGENGRKLYHYHRLKPSEKKAIPGTSMTVEPFPLNHAKHCPSTAFLIEHQENYLLHFGDTVPDTPSREKRLEPIWKRITPLLQEKKLKAIVIECSTPNKQDKSHSHLDPAMLLHELRHLQEISQTSLKEFTVIVTHRKEILQKAPDAKALIVAELTRDNDLGVHFLFPEQGHRLNI
ncbi:MAG: hypothetical protein K1000chlam4_00499 [Chlamydiae bacterium]|nr:hypothetical protein [Chlamydiota bacterium]